MRNKGNDNGNDEWRVSVKKDHGVSAEKKEDKHSRGV